MPETTHTIEAIHPTALPDARRGSCAAAAVFIEVEHDAALCIVHIRGRFATGADIEYLNGKLGQIRRTRSTRVLMDFTEVVSTGSTGISFVISVYRMVTRESDGRLVLAGANALVREALEATGLRKIIPLAEDAGSGLAALRAGRA